MGSEFPDRRWGTESSPLRRPMVALAGTPFGSWMIRTLVPLDRRLLRATGGRFTALGPIGAPTVLLTTIGRRSGEKRTSPLIYVRDDPDLFVIGSNFGQQEHPAWTWNLLTQPMCWVNTAGTDIEASATLLDGPERDRIVGEFEKMVTVYEVYRGRTDRQMRVFRLTST